MKENKSFVVHFYRPIENNKFELIVAAAGVGEDNGEAVESARNAVKEKYPAVLQSLWTAYEHHMKLEPGPLPELMPKHHP